jgi:hypothetical protein
MSVSSSHKDAGTGPVDAGPAQDHAARGASLQTDRTSQRKAPANLAGLLDELAAFGKEQNVSVRHILDTMGRRSFAPLLLFASLTGFTPLGWMPGMPTLLAAFIVLTAGQLAIGQPRLWLPKLMLELSVPGRKLERAAIKLKPFGRFVDTFIRPRLSFLTEPPFSSVIGLICVILAVTVPPLELVPLIDIPLWVAIVIFSLALFAHDGVLALIALAFTTVGIVWLATAL